MSASQAEYFNPELCITYIPSNADAGKYPGSRNYNNTEV